MMQIIALFYFMLYNEGRSYFSFIFYAQLYLAIQC